MSDSEDGAAESRGGIPQNRTRIGRSCPILRMARPKVGETCPGIRQERADSVRFRGWRGQEPGRHAPESDKNRPIPSDFEDGGGLRRRMGNASSESTFVTKP